jgi:hypothetical protein
MNKKSSHYLISKNNARGRITTSKQILKLIRNATKINLTRMEGNLKQTFSDLLILLKLGKVNTKTRFCAMISKENFKTIAK